MNIKSNKWELIAVINKVNCEGSVLKSTLESCVCVCVYYTHVNIYGGTAMFRSIYCKTRSMQNTRG